MIRYKCVYGHVYLHTMHTRIVYGIRQFFITEVIGKYSGIERHSSHVYGIRAAVHGRYKMLFASHGSQYLRFSHGIVLLMKY